MSKKTMLATFVAAATMATLVACGVPKADYDKVTTELQQATQEKAALTDQLSQANKDKTAAQQQVAELQGQVDTLKKELEKAKPAKKAKPAAKKTKK
jgi:peptidoglycan hydrolase CwlO-like protein